MTDIPGCIWGGHFLERASDPAAIATLLAAAGGTAPGGETAAYTGSDLDFEMKNAVLLHELLAGRQMGVLREYYGVDSLFPYSGELGPDGDNHDFEQWAYDRGCRMVISFQSRMTDGTYVPFSDVPTGVVDAELTVIADQIATFMHPRDSEMVICPTHEPDMAYATQIEADGLQGAGASTITVDPATVKFALPPGHVVQFTGWSSSRTVAAPGVSVGASTIPLSSASPSITADGAETVGQTVAQMRAGYAAMFIYVRTLFEDRWDANWPAFDQSKVKWATIFIGSDAFWTDITGAAALYPGNDYVDLVGADSYNGFGTATIGGQWKSLLTVMAPFLIFARTLGRSGQFMLLAETGLIEGSPVIPDGSFGPSVGAITIDIEAAQTIIPAGYVVDFFNGVTAVVANPVAPTDTTIDLVSLPGVVNATTPGAANTVVQRKAAWFTEATLDIQASIPELKYFCYFTGGGERWWVEQPYEGSEPSLLAWSAMGADTYFGGAIDTAPAPIPMLLRFLDDDEITVLLDFCEINDGASVGFGIPPDSFDLGGGELDDEWLEDYAYDGGIQAQSYRPPTSLRFELYLVGSDAADLRTRMRLLAQMLDRPRVLEYRPRGSTQSLLIDTVRSPIPKLLSGGSNQLQKVMNGFVGEEIVEIRRQAKMRLQRQTRFVRKSISNAPGDNWVLVPEGGNARSPLRVDINPQFTDTELVGVRMARKSFGDLTEAAATFLGFSVDLCDYPTGSTTTGHGTHADEDAANGFVAITAFANSVFTSRFRSPDDWRPLDPSALAGTHRVIVGGVADPGAIYKLQIRAGLVSPLPDTGDVLPLDLSNADITDPVRFSFDLGLVQFDQLGAALVLELWASSGTPGTEIAWDVLKLLPASEAIVGVYEPTYLGVIPGQTTWDPLQLVVCDHIDLPSTDAVDDGPAESLDGLGELDVTDDGRPRLGRAAVVGTGDNPDKTDEAIGTGPNTGITLAPGEYEAILAATVHNLDKARGLHAELRVRNLTDAVDVVATPLYSVKGVTDFSDVWRARFSVADATDLWQVQIVYVHDRVPTTGKATHAVYIDGLSMTITRTISPPERVVMDGLTHPPRAYGSVAAGKTHDLVTSGAPEDEGGGPALYVFHFDEKPQPGTDGADARGPLPTYWSLRRYKVQFSRDRMVNPE